MSFGALLCDIPFFIIAFFGKIDKERSITFKRRVRNLTVRFLPVFGLYALLLFAIARAAALRLPGASTAPIALLIFPPVGVLLVFIMNRFTSTGR